MLVIIRYGRTKYGLQMHHYFLLEFKIAYNRQVVNGKSGCVICLTRNGAGYFSFRSALPCPLITK